MTDWNLDDDDAWDGLTPSGGDSVEPTDEFDTDSDLVTDPTGAVAVATDDEHRVVRVVISNNWRAKVGQGLAEALRGAALLATEPLTLGDPQIASFAMVPGRTPQPIGTVVDHPMSQLEVNQLLEETLQACERLEKLDERGDAARRRSYDHTPAIGRSDNEKVRVELDLQMRPHSISIDQPWVEGARVERVVAAVQQALIRAYEQWRPPVLVPGEYDEIGDQALELRKRTLRPVLIAGGWISEDEEL